MDRIISKEEEREEMQGEILQFIFKYSEDPRRDSSIQCFYMQSSNYKLILYTELILQEIQELQGSFCAGTLQQLLPMYPSILHGRIKVPSALQCSRPLQHKQAPSNSTRQKQHSTRQPASTRSLQQLPGKIHLVSNKFYKGSSITLHCDTTRSNDPCEARHYSLQQRLPVASFHSFYTKKSKGFFQY